MSRGILRGFRELLAALYQDEYNVLPLARI
jgi:hypothetical protein